MERLSYPDQHFDAVICVFDDLLCSGYG